MKGFVRVYFQGDIIYEVANQSRRPCFVGLTGFVDEKFEIRPGMILDSRLSKSKFEIEAAAGIKIEYVDTSRLGR